MFRRAPWPRTWPPGLKAERSTASLLRSGLDYWRRRCEIVLVEGAGGLMSPLGDEEYVADLAHDFAFPLIVVSRNVLGTINATLQTLITASVYRGGLAVAGLVLNHPAPPLAEDVSLASNRGKLPLARPCRCWLPWPSGPRSSTRRSIGLRWRPVHDEARPNRSRVAKYNSYVIFDYMEPADLPIAERIQTLAATILATHPAGHQLFLIGGFRYRLLNASARASTDIDYHWEGDLQQKQAEIADVLRSKLLPEVKRQIGYDGDVRAGVGPVAESPAVQIVDTAFYRTTEPGSRIEIPIEITRVVRLDAPLVRTVAGKVFLTLSDADMIESKILAFLESRFCRVRDVLDIFLFQDALRPDAPARLSQKLRVLRRPLADAIRALDRFEANRPVHVRELERLLDEQVVPAVTANLRAAGGGPMVWESATGLLRDILTKAGELSP